MGRHRKTRRRGPSAGIIVGLVCGGVFLVVIFVLVIVSATRKGNPGAPAFVLPGIERPNDRVTEQSYISLKHGFSLAEVEAVLGKGRAPSPADFDLICGTEEMRFVNPFSQSREEWEKAASDGRLLLWANGPTRIMVFFDQPAECGGREVRKLLRRGNGSINSQ